MKSVIHKTAAARAIERCRELAKCTETPGGTTRLFLSAAMRECHRHMRAWMEAAGMTVTVDPAGNIRGMLGNGDEKAPRLLVASHLDTVPNAGAFDGVLGVVMGVGLVEELHGLPLPFAIEVIGFSEEEGVRYGAPFIGSRALTGTVDAELLARKDARGETVGDAIVEFGLDGGRIHEAALKQTPLGYLEIHIEQGPVLEAENLAVGVVDAIAGQTRAEVKFSGEANHAGTTPMHLRHDALNAAAEWMLAVEAQARAIDGLVATTGRVQATPGAVNVIAGEARVTLDVRHAEDEVRCGAVEAMQASAQRIAKRRGVTAEWVARSEQVAVAMDERLTAMLEDAARETGAKSRRMTSGAGHDAMIVAPLMPAAMLFVRSPGGVSHHPEETVREEDVEQAMQVAVEFVKKLALEK